MLGSRVGELVRDRLLDGMHERVQAARVRVEAFATLARDEGVLQHLRRARAARHLLSEHLHEEVVEGRRGGARVAERGWLLLSDSKHDAEDRAQVVVRRLTLRHLDGRDPEGPHVCPSIVLAVAHDLGRHPVRGADHRHALRRRRIQLQGDAQVGELHDAVAEQQVGALDIPMDDALALRVHVLQGAQCVAACERNLLLGERLLGGPQHIEKRPVRAELHDDPELMRL